MADSVYPDKMACYKPSDLDLHCLHRCLFWSERIIISVGDVLKFFS